MSWTRKRDLLRSLARWFAFGRPGAHAPLPVLVVAVANHECEGRAQRTAVPEPGEQLHLVLLNLLPRTAAVSLLAAAQIGVDRAPVENESGGQSSHDRDERRA